MLLDWLVIGLGNPGKQYRGSLHNAGFDVVDRLLQTYQGHPAYLVAPCWEKAGSKMEIALLRKPLPSLQGPDCPQGTVLLSKPQTYMNLSGKALDALRKYYEFVPERCIVLLDNLDLDPGRLRLKFGGGFSSHNGLRSLRDHGLSANFWRLFIGIGHPGRPEQVSSYVLRPPARSIDPQYQASLQRAALGLQEILCGRLPGDLANELNGKQVK